MHYWTRFAFVNLHSCGNSLNQAHSINRSSPQTISRNNAAYARPKSGMYTFLPYSSSFLRVDVTYFTAFTRLPLPYIHLVANKWFCERILMRYSVKLQPQLNSVTYSNNWNVAQRIYYINDKALFQICVNMYAYIYEMIEAYILRIFFITNSLFLSLVFIIRNLDLSRSVFTWCLYSLVKMISPYSLHWTPCHII